MAPGGAQRRHERRIPRRLAGEADEPDRPVPRVRRARGPDDAPRNAGDIQRRGGKTSSGEERRRRRARPRLVRRRVSKHNARVHVGSRAISTPGVSGPRASRARRPTNRTRTASRPSSETSTRRSGRTRQPRPFGDGTRKRRNNRARRRDLLALRASRASTLAHVAHGARHGERDHRRASPRFRVHDTRVRTLARQRGRRRRRLGLPPPRDAARVPRYGIPRGGSRVLPFRAERARVPARALGERGGAQAAMAASRARIRRGMRDVVRNTDTTLKQIRERARVWRGDA